MLVKICGLSNFIDATAAVDAGADALGFVMGGKVLPIEVEPPAQLVRQWISALPNTVDSYIVTHYTNHNEILGLAEYVQCTGIQVSESLSASRLQQLRSRTKRKIIKTIPVYGEESYTYLKEVQPHCDSLLLDSVVEGYIGGTGKPNDWNQCAKLLQLAEKPVFLAGGLNVTNLHEVLKLVHPEGVDVSTGVSTYSENYLRKDRKDSEKVKKFIQNAKSWGTE